MEDGFVNIYRTLRRAAPPSWARHGLFALALVGAVELAPRGVFAQDFTSNASGGTLSLRADELAPPQRARATITAQTPLEGVNLGVRCEGFIDSSAPLLRLLYTRPTLAEARARVVVQAQSEGVQALLVNSSNGRWYCVRPENGVLAWSIDDPNSGQIDVWPVLRVQTPRPVELLTHVEDAAP